VISRSKEVVALRAQLASVKTALPILRKKLEQKVHPSERLAAV
jgi:hypothetical protein